MGTQAVSFWTAGRSPLIVVVPLTVQIVGHVDDVVNYLGDVVDGVGFQIPKGSRSCDGE